MAIELPSGAAEVAEDFPEIWEAYSRLGHACAEGGPLDERDRRLIKLALAIGLGSEGATHSHSRQALEEGFSAEELRHVAMLAIPTIGFPRAVAALTWVEDTLEEADELDDEIEGDDQGVD